MLNIGKLNTLAVIKRYAQAADSYGQMATGSLDSTQTIYVRKIQRKGSLENDADSLHGRKEEEFIARYNENIRLNDQLEVVRYRSNKNLPKVYEITDVEEIGRGVGIKIRATLLVDRSSS
jgi:head-tail adaptor